jgi:hypothetical protein
MIKLRVILLTLTVFAGLHAECMPGGMAVVVNKANPAESVSMAQLRKFDPGRRTRMARQKAGHRGEPGHFEQSVQIRAGFDHAHDRCRVPPLPSER